MKVQLNFLICSILIAYCSAYLHPMPDKLVVTEANKHELGLPIGTELIKDTRTELYVPPEITDEFDAEARLEIQFNNKVTSRNYCRVGPGVDGTRIRRKIYWKNFCRDSDGEDICCGDTRCSCDMISNNCSCLSKRGFAYYEEKKQKNFNSTLRAANTVVGALGHLDKLKPLADAASFGSVLAGK